MDSPDFGPDLELRDVAAAWATLPAALRTAIFAIVRSASQESPEGS